ncbi:MAG TPA: DNA polymerase/3'-5' exonuclease PolX [Dehalococcoidia bacterium]|nr:DNA polymerase/3'-5' exonuclease PolX [Dehalococcoidia bacterium]
MRNREVAAILDEVADLMELLGEDRYRVARYRDAAMKIEHFPEPIENLEREGRVQAIRGVGKSIGGKVEEYLRSGSLRQLEELRARVPPAALTLMRIPGVGPKRALLLTERLGVRSVDDLAQAIERGDVARLPRMGPKVAEQLLEEIHRLRTRSKRIPLGVAAALADDVVRLLSECKAAQRIEAAGSLRRMQETIGDIDILVASAEPSQVIDAFVRMAIVRDVLAAGDTRASVLTQNDLQVDVRVVPGESWGAALQYFTGSKEHNVRLRELAVRRGWRLSEYGLFDGEQRIAGSTEAEVYEALGLAWVPPELRENQGEIEAALAHQLPDLIGYGDLRGDLHAHTRLSDGSSTIEQMAEAAAARGYEYLAITDHSQALGVARGMTEDELRAEHAAIRRAQAMVPTTRLLCGVEVDIRVDSRLDCSDDFLAECDVVVASIHSAFQRSAADQTARLIAAIEHPCVDIVGHPTGRMLGKRRGYDIDLAAVLDAAARTGTALEVNAQPNRLDLPADAIRAAVERGVMLAINTDAHEAQQLGQTRLGIGTARRGWVPSDLVLNALPLEGLLAWLRERRSRAAA